MPIDDHPFDVLDRQLALEDAFVSPVGKAVLSIASSIPLPSPLDKAVARIRERIGADSLDKVHLMLETCMSEVRRQGEEIKSLSERLSRDEAEGRVETAKELLLDAARKAEATRDRERVKRIGMILAHAMAEPAAIDGDEVEELMRVAMQLSDQDVRVLAELVRRQEPFFDSNSGRANYDDVSRYWAGADRHGYSDERRRPTVAMGISDGDLQTACAKLQAFGLVVQMDASSTFRVLGSPPFSILSRGIRFIRFIESSAPASI